MIQWQGWMRHYLGEILPYKAKSSGEKKKKKVNPFEAQHKFTVSQYFDLCRALHIFSPDVGALKLVHLQF